jgi:1,4-alpha-glucan branching enzyme
MRTPKSTLNNSSTSTAAVSSKADKAKPAARPAKQYGPRQMKNAVLFTASYPEAKEVQIAGDFNSWQPEKNPMKKTDEGSWQATIPLAKGTYRYRFIVDGQWQHDPNNNSTEPNPYGDLNSVFNVV